MAPLVARTPPHASSPSPKATTMSAAPSPAVASPSWHFPGPSSRYHTRERSNSQSRLPRPAYHYASTAPTLATEIRAHRRTQSSYTTSSQSTPHGPKASSPRPTSQHARSPLGRFLADGHDIIKSRSHHAHHAHRRYPSQPVTPNKSSNSRPRVPRDSPFSDYFTDEARSVDQVVAPTAVQQVLAHLAKLQSQLIRNATSDNATGSQKIEDNAALALVERKLDEVGSALNGMSCAPQRNRVRHQLSDSGIELEAEEEAEEDNNSSHDGSSYHHITTSFDSSTASSLSNPTSPFNDSPYLTATLDILATSPDTTPLPPPQFSAAAATAMNHPQRLHTQMISLVRSVSVAQAELRQRCAEQRRQIQLEDHESVLAALRSENHGLQTVLELENSELLFLKLQMKLIELEARHRRSQEEDTDGQEQKGDQSLASIDQWQEDWQDIEERFGRQNSGYDDDNALPERSTPARFEVSESGSAVPRRSPWLLETTKDEDGAGRVVSITIKRVLPIEHNDVGVPNSSVELNEMHEETSAAVVEDLQHLTELPLNPDAATELDAEEHVKEELECEPISFAEQSTQTECKSTSFVEHSTQTASSTTTYVSQSTQTEVTDIRLPPSSSCELDNLEELDTNSAQDGMHVYEKSTPGPESPLERRKSAWNELWTGLSSFAGMEDDE